MDRTAVKQQTEHGAIFQRSKGLRSMAWWYLALSRTTTMRLPRERCRRSFFKRFQRNRVEPSHMVRMNLPVLRRPHRSRRQICGWGRASAPGPDLRWHPHAASGAAAGSGIRPDSTVQCSVSCQVA